MEDQSQSRRHEEFHAQHAQDGLYDRAARVHRELRSLLWDLYQRRKLEEPPGRASEVDLRLSLRLFPAEGSAEEEEARFARDLLSRLDDAVEADAARIAPFPPGRVRCFWCASFECEHASPPASRAIFGGYGPTGLPLWPELAAAALEKRWPRLDDLYSEPPAPLCVLQDGRELVSERLPVYSQNNAVYRLLGQIVLGYLPVPSARSTQEGQRGERESLAITIQAVEVQRGGRPRVLLNAIGRLPDGSDLEAFFHAEPASRLASAIETARTRLTEIRAGGRRRARRGRSPREVIAQSVLEHLARNLERIFRQAPRRTLHAQRRHQDRERPTASALRDALDVRADQLFRDVRQGTWVVVGPHTRVHFFNDSGQHVTSVAYPGETVRRRTAQGLWKAVDQATAETFRAMLRRVTEAGTGEIAKEAPASPPRSVDA